MIKVIEVSVRRGVTKNLGNYESARVDFEARATVGKEDNPDDVVSELRSYVDQNLVQLIPK